MTSKKQECFVYMTLPGQTDQITAGKYVLEKTEQGIDVGHFVYGRSYLSRADAVEIDPIELKLENKVFNTVTMKGVFGALRDASPDYWGRRIIERNLKVAQADEMTYLLQSADDRIGALGFGFNQTPPAPNRVFNQKIQLDRLQKEAELLVNEEVKPENPITAQVQELLLIGTSMGGARPKAVIEDDNKLWVAKFNRMDDKWNNALVEYAMLKLAEKCGIKGYRVKDYCDDILKLKDYTHYFNSGVLGFNIKKCREFALTDKLLKRLAEVKNPMIVDQDIFNSVCEGRVFYYSPDWNVEWHTYYLYGNLLPYQLPRDFYEKYLKVIKNPSILHYAVDMKPWDCPEHSTAEIFWHYAQKTPFFARIIYKHFEQKIYALSRQKPEKAAVRAAEVQKIPLKDKLKYYRYKFLSFAAFGSKKSYYGEKKRKMKQKIKSIRSRELSAC